MMLQHSTVIMLRFCKRWEVLPSKRLSQIIVVHATQLHFVFRNDYIFWSKKPIIRPPLQKLSNKV